MAERADLDALLALRRPAATAQRPGPRPQLALRAVAVLAALAALGGCAGARKEPLDVDVSVAASYRGAQPSDFARAGADIPWWETYSDAALVRLIRLALDRNRDIQLAVARIEETRALIGPAQYAEFPRLFAGADASREYLPQNYRFQIPSGGNRDIQLYGATVSASYEIDFWGRLKSLEAAVRADFLASRYAREAVAITLIGDVAQSYFDILSSRQQLALTRSTLLARSEFADLTQRRFDSGRASAVEVSRARGAQLGVQARIPQLEQQLALLENRLAILVGAQPGDADMLVPANARLPAAPEVPAGLPSALLERRPDLLAAQQDLEAASFRTDAQQAALLPALSLTATLGLQSRALSDLLTGGAFTRSLGAGVLQPIIDASRNKFLVQAQEARERQALIRYQRAAENAFREVSDALIARAQQARLRAILREQVQVLGRAATLSEQRFKAGLAAYFEVIDAQSELLAAQIAENEAQRALLATTVGLYKSLGGGWDPVAFAQGAHSVSRDSDSATAR